MKVNTYRAPFLVCVYACVKAGELVDTIRDARKAKESVLQAIKDNAEYIICGVAEEAQ